MIAMLKLKWRASGRKIARSKQNGGVTNVKKSLSPSEIYKVLAPKWQDLTENDKFLLHNWQGDSEIGELLLQNSEGKDQNDGLLAQK